MAKNTRLIIIYYNKQFEWMKTTEKCQFIQTYSLK